MDTRTLPERTLQMVAELDGDSPPMLALKAAIVRLAPADAPVLVHGETGTGKEQVARQLHRLSARAAGPFVAVHAGALAPGFFDADGAGDDDGTARAAAAGTLFIDALEELSPETQAALLHFLRDVGEATRRARVVGASQWDGAALAQGPLRADLVNHLAALRLAIPPLRERREDLPGLVSRLLAELGAGRELRLSDAAATAAVLHGWPGNVRELHNRLAQAVLVADAGTLGPESLGLPAPGRPNSLSLREMRRAAEREAITRALRQSHGQVPAAAAILGISRAQLYRLISRLGLDHHAVADTMDASSRTP